MRFAPVPDRGNPQRSAAEYADRYLSVGHRDNRATSCLFSSLGTEAARGSAELRHSMTEAVRRRIGHLSAEAKGDTPHAKRRAAITDRVHSPRHRTLLVGNTAPKSR
jgi:TetR/AcrR family transcriptional repressor of nem operon